MFEARDQPFRQVMLAHTPLDSGNVVRHAPGFPDVGFDVEDGVGGVGVLVARLADAAGVDDLAAAVELAALAVGRLNGLGFALLGHHLVDDRLVGVADQAVGRLEMREVERGDQWF